MKKPGPGAKPEPGYNVGAPLMWIAHVVIVSLDLGRTHWSAGFPVWLQALGVIGTLGGNGATRLGYREYAEKVRYRFLPGVW